MLKRPSGDVASGGSVCGAAGSLTPTCWRSVSALTGFGGAMPWVDEPTTDSHTSRPQ